MDIVDRLDGDGRGGRKGPAMSESKVLQNGGVP